MLRLFKQPSLITAAGLALAVMSGSALADQPYWAEGQQKHSKYDNRYDKKQYKKHRKDHEKRLKKQRKHDSAKYRFHKNDRRAAYSYYGQQNYRRNCPPGLAKKNNGCQPPGQYKKWQKGKTLGKHTRYYELPPELRHRMSRPHDGYRYVRVDNDVLLVDIVTHVVVDAIENILR